MTTSPLSPAARRLQEWLWSEHCARAAVRDGVVKDRREFARLVSELREHGLIIPLPGEPDTASGAAIPGL